MLMAFEKNKVYLNLKSLGITIDTLRSNETKIVSLKDVDSPEFTDMLLRNRIVISPELESAVKRCGLIESELVKTNNHKLALQTSNEQLQSEISNLLQENKSLSNQLQTSTSSSEKKYKGKMDKLQAELDQLTIERDSLKRKIDEASSSIDLIEQPFQKLTRLLAGRFPENHSSKYEERTEETRKVPSQNQHPVWRDWLNSILLALVLVCCCVILVFVLKNKQIEDETPDTNTSFTTTIVDEETPAIQETAIHVDESVDEDAQDLYSDWNECTINVIGSTGGVVKKNTKYTVKVCLKKDWSTANVPKGTWLIDLGDNNPINSEGINSFVVPNDLASGTNMLVKYVYNNVPVVTRTVKVK